MHRDSWYKGGITGKEMKIEFCPGKGEKKSGTRQLFPRESGSSNILEKREKYKETEGGGKARNRDSFSSIFLLFFFKNWVEWLNMELGTRI